MTYTVEHQDALRAVEEAGSRTAFVVERPGQYDEATDSWTDPEEVLRVEGAALRVRGDPRTYEALALRESEAPTLLFVPDELGRDVPLDAGVEFGGKRYAVAHVVPVAPDGAAILHRVVVKS